MFLGFLLGRNAGLQTRHMGLVAAPLVFGEIAARRLLNA